MSISRLLKWQWEGYPKYHQSRANLLIHIFAVPLFLVGTIALVTAITQLSLLLFLVAIGCIAVAIALQGRGHRLEAVPPEPFSGPLNFVSRLFFEQWITFPRFVLSGGWTSELERLRAAIDRGRDTLLLGSEPYGVHDVFLPAGKATEIPDLICIASDDCGNNYELNLKSKSVQFRDHETDDVRQVASSLVVFVDSLIQWERPPLDPAKVKRAWIDPEFAKDLTAKGPVKKK
jgi:hypothetical protein